jgi:ABC-type bacteriocin/lantibiotic exporter with double-glycine peptidase domain
MAIWLEILRASCASVVFVYAVLASILTQIMGIPQAHERKLGPSVYLQFILFLPYASELVKPFICNDPPIFLPTYSSTGFVLALAIQLDNLHRQPMWHAHWGSWAAILGLETLTIAKLLSDYPTLVFGPLPTRAEPIFDLVVAALKVLTSASLLICFRQTDSSVDIEVNDRVTIKNDEWLGMRQEAEEEMREIGGWQWMQKFAIFWELIWPTSRLLQLRMALTFLLVVADSLLDLFKPRQLGILIDDITAGSSWGQIRSSLMIYATLYLLSRGADPLQKWLWADVSIYRSKNLYTRAHEKIMRLDHSYHDKVHPTDTLKAVEYAASVDGLLDFIWFNLLPNLTSLFCASAVLLQFGPFMVLILIAITVFYIINARRSLTTVSGEYDKYIAANTDGERRRQDGIRGWETVVDYNRIESEAAAYSSQLAKLTAQWRSYEMFSILYSIFSNFILGIGYILAFVLVTYNILVGRATAGSLMAFVGYWRSLTVPLKFFTYLPQNTLKKLYDATRLRRIMEMERRVKDGDQDLQFSRGSLEFSGVNFGYGGKLVLDKFNLSILANTTTALVGPSGIGKTTILRLLLREYDPTGGSIYVDGQDITRLKISS